MTDDKWPVCPGQANPLEEAHVRDAQARSCHSLPERVQNTKSLSCRAAHAVGHRVHSAPLEPAAIPARLVPTAPRRVVPASRARRRHLGHRPNRLSRPRAPRVAHQTVRYASITYPGAHRLPLGRGRSPAHAPFGVDTLANRAVEMCATPAIPSSLVSHYTSSNPSKDQLTG
jgi:hypothetical protein